MLKRSSHNPTIQAARLPAAQLRRAGKSKSALTLNCERTVVATRLHLKRRSPGALHLDGSALKLLFVAVDGKRLAARRYRVHDDGLDIDSLPEQCVLDIAVEIAPTSQQHAQRLVRVGGKSVYAMRGRRFSGASVIFRIAPMS